MSLRPGADDLFKTVILYGLKRAHIEGLIEAIKIIRAIDSPPMRRTRYDYYQGLHAAAGEMIEAIQARISALEQQNKVDTAEAAEAVPADEIPTPPLSKGE